MLRRDQGTEGKSGYPPSQTTATRDTPPGIGRTATPSSPRLANSPNRLSYSAISPSSPISERDLSDKKTSLPSAKREIPSKSGTKGVAGKVMRRTPSPSNEIRGP